MPRAKLTHTLTREGSTVWLRIYDGDRLVSEAGSGRWGTEDIRMEKRRIELALAKEAA